MKIIINTISAKKKAGGAFQVAYNFIKYSIEHNDNDIDWYYIVSEDIDSSLELSLKSQIPSEKYFKFPTQPDLSTYLKVKKQLKHIEESIQPILIYTITAPCYFLFKSKEVIRYTNPWVVHPNSFAWKTLSFSSVVRTKLYSLLQKYFIKRSQYIITQAETTKAGLQNINPQAVIAVVPNVLPNVFQNIDVDHIDATDGTINIVSVSAPHPHKHINIIPSLIRELQSIGLNNVRFHITLPKDSSVWQIMERELLRDNNIQYVVNHGRCTQKELAEIYRKCDIAFLPSLLEVFSASSLEAMYFGLPIVATDLNFNTDLLKDAALYYKPMDASDASKQIARIIMDDNIRKLLKYKMKNILSQFSDYNIHFNDTTSFLKSIGSVE